jgi:hypothetical protein
MWEELEDFRRGQNVVPFEARTPGRWSRSR